MRIRIGNGMAFDDEQATKCNFNSLTPMGFVVVSHLTNKWLMSLRFIFARLTWNGATVYAGGAL